MGVASLAHMHASTTQFLLRNILAGDGLNHIRAGHKHLGGLIHHDHEVGQGGGISIAAGA